MKNLIQQLIREALEKRLPDTTISQELKYASPSSLSKPNRKLDMGAVRFRIAKAAETASNFKQENPEDNYFMAPNEGDGFYQVKFSHDGEIRTKHIKASSDMEQRGGAFQPTDVGTCKTFQNIARYCFVKAGKGGRSVGASPAEDAANKALIIFRTEILDFLEGSTYDDGKGSEISKEKMTDKQAKHKEKKDLETKIGRRLSDSEWLRYQETGQEPQTKGPIASNPEADAEFEKKQQMALDRRNAALARRRVK